MKNKNRYTRLTRLTRQFSLYTFIGIIFTLATIFFMWLAVDVLQFPTLISTIFVVGGLFILKYFVNIWSGLLHHAPVRYLLVTFLLLFAQIYFTWFLIEIVLLSAAVGSAIITIVLFLFRFLLFKIFGMVQ